MFYATPAVKIKLLIVVVIIYSLTDVVTQISSIMMRKLFVLGEKTTFLCSFFSLFKAFFAAFSLAVLAYVRIV